MKRLLVIMLILVAVGVVNAGTIKIVTDMKFYEHDITLYRKILDHGPHAQYEPMTDFFYNRENREITNLIEGNNLYWVIIKGDPLLNFGPCEISVEGIDFRSGNYVVIKKMFFLWPDDPGTPITE
ncbi:MAG: hypothetical protein WC155_01080 [Candidatus Cloacimonadales bacterium]